MQLPRELQQLLPWRRFQSMTPLPWMAGRLPTFLVPRYWILGKSLLGPNHFVNSENEARPRVRGGLQCGWDQRFSSGRYSSFSDPVYSARGRIIRLCSNCSRIWAVQPEIRETAKIGVNRSMGIPIA